ncbi:MAG: hypothetical protein ABH851_02350 [Methanobacteriota archaeon]
MKVRKIFLLSIIFMLFLSLTVSADSLGRKIGNVFVDILCEMWCAFKVIVPAIAVLVIALAGALWLYSQDDAAKRNTAKTWIIHAIIGLIIAGLAYTISWALFPPGHGIGCAGC